MDKKILIGIVIALLGFYFLGTGITGFVVSQSCCFPPDCEQENLCSVSENNNITKGSLWPVFTLLGTLLMFAAFLVVIKRKS
jgi:hypothetical protein